MEVVFRSNFLAMRLSGFAIIGFVISCSRMKFETIFVKVCLFNAIFFV